MPVGDLAWTIISRIHGLGGPFFLSIGGFGVIISINNPVSVMGMIFALIVSSVAGYIGWWIGDFFGIAAALMLSSITSAIGYWYGMKWNREYFS